MIVILSEAKDLGGPDARAAPKSLAALGVTNTGGPVMTKTPDPGLSRRAVLTTLAAVPAALAVRSDAGPAAAEPAARVEPRQGPRRHVVVVGAGAFGSFTALALARRGTRVTLLDAWGPGNARASSGGETRVIRGVYADRAYVELAAEALTRWQELEARWQRRLYHSTGALWMASGPADFVRAAQPHLQELGFPFEELSAAEAARRFPQIRFEGIGWALFEPRAGYLLARRACAAAVEALVAAGGEYRQAEVRPGRLGAGGMEAVELGDGSRLAADAYVFCCGPWLGRLFPEEVGERIRPTRQEVFYFGTPAGDPRFEEGSLPIWIEVGERLFYGIPGNEHRGFKVADDTRGEAFDPTAGERVTTATALARARELLARRFPALAGSPLLETRVCQYENSPDAHFILDRHSQAENCWLVGGGSGHGFKFAPAWGERVAATVLGERAVDPFFGLARFEEPG